MASQPLSLGQFIRERRLAAELTQEQLAAKSGYSQPTISQWERGSELPRLIHLSRLASLLGFDIGEAARLVQPEAEPSEPAA
jgi:transcriptional regulator with XRE-family HTH domain